MYNAQRSDWFRGGELRKELVRFSNDLEDAQKAIVGDFEAFIDDIRYIGKPECFDCTDVIISRTVHAGGKKYHMDCYLGGQSASRPSETEPSYQEQETMGWNVPLTSEQLTEMYDG